MPAPNLIHPINIEIEQLNRAGTIVDDDFREPVQDGVRTTRVNIQGQPKWGLRDRQTHSKTGSNSDADGYVLFRTADLAAAGVTLKQGDRFVSTGIAPNKVDIDVYIVSFRPEGHYQDQGGPSLLKAFFKDRWPSKQTPGGK